MPKNLILTTLLCLSITLAGQTPIFHLNFDEEAGETTTEQVSGSVLSIRNTFNRPERISANFGNALRLDGYSTYIADLNYFIQNYTDKLTIEAWYATEAFTKEPAAIIQSQSNSGGFKLQTNSFGNVIFSFFFNGQERSLKPNKRLTTYQWHHIVATVDAAAGKANIYVDGENWLSNNFAQNSSLNTTQSTLWAGKSSLNQVFAGFSLNTLNGAIDDIKVYNDALTEEQILAHYQLATIREAGLFIDPNIRHADDYLRPQYHPMPNTSWTNEPYGFTYYGGKYHLFFQKNPNGPYLYFMHWGHLSSPNLVSWTEEPIPLAPSFGFDDFGVWSGTTAFDNNGNPVIFYTGVDGQKAGIGSAYPLDDGLIKWEENNTNPLISNPPPNFFSLDFRDPYVFKKDGLYYMIVGSGLSNDGGGILFTYTSTDLESWTLVTPLFQSSDYVNHGAFWEMPALIPFNDTDYALVVTPQFPGAPADVIYWAGTFDGTTFNPYDSEPKRLEHISKNLLAPAFGRDEEDRWTYIGIIPDDRDVALQIAAGWRHTFSIPRLARLLDDGVTLSAIPHPNLCRLRIDSTAVRNRTITANTNHNLPEFRGTQCELAFSLNFSSAEVINLQVYKHPNSSEKTSVILDRGNNRIGLDRTQSSPYATVEDLRFQDYIFNPAGDVKIRMFLDRSTLEVFVDNLVVFSSRVYPSEASDLIDIRVEGGEALLEAFNGYQLDSKENTFSAISCPPADLPNSLYTSAIELPDQKQIRVFPNPTTGFLYLESEVANKIRVFDIQGRLLAFYSEATGEIDLHNFKAGIYILQLENKYGIFTFKIIKE
ncbi:MAG: GH32 C-terminal domain-containing protein [Phaeodactylibacter sp.]|nr:GH32 C-terminal domain-containing protein [Phaeodactylibacter sp.]